MDDLRVLGDGIVTTHLGLEEPDAATQIAY